jgi:hypothetical protein
MAPNPIIFLNRDNLPPIFRKGSIVILGNTYDIRLRDIIQNIPSERNCYSQKSAVDSKKQCGITVQ